jgi:hypothetical protein
MALQKTFNLTFATQPVEFINSYIRVDEVVVNKSASGIKVGFYTAQDGELIRTEGYTGDISVADGSENAFKQAYLYLKTLPEFSNAEDV